MKRALLLICLLMAGCPEDSSSGFYLPGFTSPSSKPKATPTPIPGASVTPTPKPGTATPTPTPKPGTVTPKPTPTPTPAPGYGNPSVVIGAQHNVWSVSEPMTTLRAGLVAWVYNGKIYAADGDGSGTMEEYIPSTGTWKVGGYFKESHYFALAELIDGKLYQASGFSGDVYYSKVLQYDHATGATTELATLPAITDSEDPIQGGFARGRSHAGGGVLTYLNTPCLFLFGGNLEGTVFNQFARFYPPSTSDPAGKWEVTTPYRENFATPDPRAAMGSGVINNTLYFVGGYDNAKTVLNSILAYEPNSNAWINYGQLATMSKARHSLMVACLGGYLYAIGGADASNKVLGDVERYDPVHNTWTACASLPTPRAMGAAVALNGRIYVLGGFDANGKSLRSVEVYDP